MNIEQLIKLSKIFKQGFTVECSGHELKQYTNYKKPYIVSYKTIIEISDTKINYKNMDKLPYDCIIGGWSNGGTYFIEINKAFKGAIEAMKFAWKHKQQAIYDIRTGDVIEVQRF